jgi:hypothetical protein
MKTEAILSKLRQAKKKVDAERERLHRVIAALEMLGSKAITAGKEKYKQSAKAKQAISKAQKARWAKFRAKKKSANA